MFQFLNSISTWLSSACALGFAAFWGWSSVFLNTKAAPDGKIFDQAGWLLMVGFGVGVIVVGLYLLATMARGEKTLAQAPASNSVTEISQDDFDPDAIIAHHLAMRALAPKAAPRVRPADRFLTTTHTRSFGRKLA